MQHKQSIKKERSVVVKERDIETRSAIKSQSDSSGMLAVTAEDSDR